MNNKWTKGCDFGFKVGQKAWSNRYGFGTITEIIVGNPTHIKYCSDNGDTLWYHIDGRWSEDDLFPSLFHVEQTFDYSRPKWVPEAGELCWVWDCGWVAPELAIHKKGIFFKSRNLEPQVTWDNYAPFNGGKLPDEFKHLEGGSK